MTPSRPASRPPRSSRARRRAPAVALLSAVLGSALVLVAAGQVWGEATTAFAQGEVGGELPIEATGSDVSSVPPALALVGLAAVVAVFAVRRAARAVVAGLLALCGTGIAVGAVRGASDTTALQDRAARATGLADSALSGVTHSAWPWASALGGALLFAAGLLALVYGSRWPAMSSRYERGGTGPGRKSAAGPRPPADPDRPEELWKALDRGEDPTHL